jgi:FtsH-binding integral membrane protein
MNYGIANSQGFVAYASPDVRADFIRKVYSLFFLSVLVTVAVGAFCAQPALAPAMLGLTPILLIAGFVVIIALMFARRTPGLNVALLYLFAAIEGAVYGPALTLIQRQAPGIPAQAAFLTAAVFGGLSLYALQSKRDFSYLGGFLFAGLIAMVVAGFVMFFFHSALMYTIYCVVGVLIFCGYVLFDTSLIMKKLGPDEAVTGAINLYLDLLNLFWLILQLLQGSSRRD